MHEADAAALCIAGACEMILFHDVVPPGQHGCSGILLDIFNSALVQQRAPHSALPPAMQLSAFCQAVSLSTELACDVAPSVSPLSPHSSATLNKSCRFLFSGYTTNASVAQLAHKTDPCSGLATCRMNCEVLV